MSYDLSNMSDQELMDLYKSEGIEKPVAYDNEVNESQGIGALSDSELLEMLDVNNKDKGVPTLSETLIDQSIQGFTLGFADEAMSGTEALIAKLSGDKRSFTDIYEKNQTDREIRLARQADKYTAASIGANIVGGVANPLNFLLGGAAQGTKIGAAIAKAGSKMGTVGRAAVEGGIFGAGVAGQDERIEGAFKGAIAGAAMSSLPKVIGKASSGTKSFWQKVKGETPADSIEKAFINVTGANSKQMAALEKNIPQISELMVKKGIIRNPATSIRGMYRNATKVANSTGKALRSIRNSVQKANPAKITEKEVAASMINQIKDPTKFDPTVRDSVIKKVNAKIKDMLKSDRTYNIDDAFNAKVQAGKQAFGHSLNAPGGSAGEELQNILRVAYDEAIKKRVFDVHGEKGIKLLERLNAEYSGITKLKDVLSVTKSNKSVNFLDRLTIGAAIAGFRNPGVAFGLLGGREFYKAVAPKLQFGAKKTTESAAKQLRKGAVRRGMVPVFTRKED